MARLATARRACCITMIRVFPRKTNATPDDDLSFTDGPPLFRIEDDVYVSCTFTWDKPQAEFLAKQWESQGYLVKVGGPAYNDRGDEFVPGRFIKKGYVVTSRGCNNKCWFCLTWRREGPIRELPITDGWNVLDSNLLQCSQGHIKAVFEMLAQQPKRARFTGGLETTRLNDWHVGLLSDLNPEIIFFAYDTPDDYEPLVVATGMIKDAIPQLISGHRLRCYVLIGYPKDTMSLAEQRLKDVLSMGVMPMAMLYRGDDVTPDIEWKRFQRMWVRPELIYTHKTVAR